MSKLVKSLRDRTTLKYMGNCKCMNCQLMPRPMIDAAADRIEVLEAALTGLVEHYAARTFTGTIVSGSEQYPWIAKALAALKQPRSSYFGTSDSRMTEHRTTLVGEKTDD